jgi:hypothetical protein
MATTTEKWWVICPLADRVLGTCDSEEEAFDLIVFAEQFAPLPKGHGYAIKGPMIRYTIPDPITGEAVGFIHFQGEKEKQ